MKKARLVQIIQEEISKVLKEGSMQARELADRNSLQQLQAMYDELMRDMEQEAEPEGGPIADQYADQMQDIEDAMQIKRGKSKEMTYGDMLHKNYPDKYGPGGVELDKDAFTKSSKFDRINEITDPGGQGIYPKKEKPGDMFQQKEVEGLFPNGMASRSDKSFQDRLKKHADWTEQDSFNRTFVHMQYNETKGLEDEYFIYQSQFYNGNYDDFRNPRFTELIIRKNKDTENEENLGTYIVDTDAYIKDIQALRSRGVLADTVSEGMVNEMAVNEMATFYKVKGDKAEAKKAIKQEKEKYKEGSALYNTLDTLEKKGEIDYKELAKKTGKDVATYNNPKSRGVLEKDLADFIEAEKVKRGPKADPNKPKKEKKSTTPKDKKKSSVSKLEKKYYVDAEDGGPTDKELRDLAKSGLGDERLTNLQNQERRKMLKAALKDLQKKGIVDKANKILDREAYDKEFAKIKVDIADKVKKIK